MLVVVASDSESAAETLQQHLLNDKLCSDVRLLSLNSVADRAAQFRPRAVVLYLPENPERAVPLVIT